MRAQREFFLCEYKVMHADNVWPIWFYLSLSNTSVYLTTSQCYSLHAFVGQCVTTHRRDRGALQPAALPADDVRAAV